MKSSILAMLITAGQLLIFFPLIVCEPAWALLPREVVVVANSSVDKSVELSKRYIRARNIPQENLFQVELAVTEVISRDDYDRKLVQPLRQFLSHLPHGDRIRCLVLMYGMPLKVDAPPLTAMQQQRAVKLEQDIMGIRLQLSKIQYKNEHPELRLMDQLEKATLEKKQLEPLYRRASLDSELMVMLVKNYPIDGWLANPFFLGFRDQKELIDKNKILMVSRLDGPSPGSVIRILADTFVAEKKGLRGTAYFDARWSNSKKLDEKKKGYYFYDRSIHRSAAIIKQTTQIPVVLDQKETLFQPGECPQAALYCGWYSLGKYIPAFTWARGAVGYHIASTECATLSKPGSQVWCKRMLEEGIAATIGPVEEPYVQAFPVPSIFFSYLVQGNLTLSECYLLSLPYFSWKMVLIGDPLYRPFKGLNKIN